MHPLVLRSNFYNILVIDPYNEYGIDNCFVLMV